MTKRPINPGAELHIGQTRTVAHLGSVTLRDYCGTDASISRAARVSYGRHNAARTEGEDAKLIGYLMRHRHTSPFEMCELVFHIRAPIFVARQWMRHRMASINEISLRYTEAENDAVMDVRGLGPLCRDPDPKDSKQGRGKPLELGPFTPDALDKTAWGSLGFALDLQQADLEYKHARKAGIAREQARVLLPLATMTEWVWKVDLHNLLHFLGLRTKPDAQREIRLLADEIAAIVADAYPLTWAAWVEHVRDAPRLSASAWRALAGIVDADRLADALSGLPERERRETLAALTSAWGAR